MHPEVYLKYPFVFLTGFVIVYVMVPFIRRFAPAWGLVDMPGERRIHARPVPLGGGLAVFAGFHGACAAVFFMPWMPFAAQVGMHW